LATLSTLAIMPVKGCSPLGSTQVNFGPKSLNIALAAHMRYISTNTRLSVRSSPKKTSSLGCDEVYAVFVSPVIDLELLAQRRADENHGLVRFSMLPMYEAITPAWKPLIIFTVISCPGLPGRFLTGTYAFNSAKRGTVASARDIPTSSSLRKNWIWARKTKKGGF
jgi:hypothetical protein